MALESTHTVDAVGIEKESGLVVLTIVDSWDWDDIQSHLLALQTKFNAYFQFVEGGQIWESYPDAVGRQLAIDVVCRHTPPEGAKDFLEKAAKAASQLGVVVRQYTLCEFRERENR